MIHKKTVYGFGLTKEAEKIHKQVIPSTKHSTFHASTLASNESNHESEIAELRKENASLKASESEIAELKKENASLKASVEQIMKTLNMQQVNLPSNE